jgi:hypothetical protein
MEAMQKFLTCKQTNGQSINDYCWQLVLWCATIEHFGGTVVGNFRLADLQWLYYAVLTPPSTIHC